MAEKRKISLVLADVDGTLVTEEKVLTKRAQNAVRALQSAGIRFAITSGRPPLGMAMLFDALKLDTPIAGFNGGLFVEPNLTTAQGTFRVSLSGGSTPKTLYRLLASDEFRDRFPWTNASSRTIIPTATIG